MSSDFMLNSISVPFSKPGLYGGLAKATGLISLSNTALTLEFEIREELFGALKSSVKEIEIHFLDIECLELKKILFWPKLIIKTTKLRSLKEVPGSHQSQVKLNIPRKKFDEAKSLVSIVNMKISEARLKQLEKKSLNLLDN
jgi:hypothetical protein